jgi:predicted alpha/beta hydrolase family esterase
MSERLFLHYGPGGNSSLERELYKNDNSKIIFWDQEHNATDGNRFNDLVQQCLEKKISTQADILIAHSFGCDLVSDLFNQSLLSSETIVLISPLKNVQKGFFQLAANLSKAQPSVKLDRFLTEQLQSKDYLTEQTAFWNICALVSEHPLYNRIFWSSDSFYQTASEILTKSKPFDADFWQKTVYEYLFHFKKSLNFPSHSNIFVIFGEDDPYLDQDSIHHWTTSLGSDRVFFIKNSGHFPHIEQKSEFLLILNKILEKKANSSKL